MNIRLIPRFGLAILLATVAGCASMHSSGPSTVRIGFTPLTDPPARGQGRMLVHPFADHHPNGPQDLPGAKDPVVIAPDQTLANVMTDAFANAGRFAGYEVVVGTEAPSNFRPQ